MVNVTPTQANWSVTNLHPGSNTPNGLFQGKLSPFEGPRSGSKVHLWIKANGTKAANPGTLAHLKKDALTFEVRWREGEMVVVPSKAAIHIWSPVGCRGPCRSAAVPSKPFRQTYLAPRSPGSLWAPTSKEALQACWLRPVGTKINQWKILKNLKHFRKN